MAKILSDSILFLYDSQSDDAVLSGGSWALPLSNLQNSKLEWIARSNNLDLSSTIINVALRRPVQIAAIYLGWTNLSSFAKVRVRFWPTSSFSGSPDFDSDWVDGLIPDDNDPDRGPSLYFILSEDKTSQYVSIEIDDRLNFSNTIDIGRLIIGKFVKPSRDIVYDGGGFNFVSRAIVTNTLSGDEIVWDRSEPRTFSMNFQYLPKNEVFGDIYHMLRTIKRGGEIVVIPKPNANTLELQRRSFLGRAVNRDPIIQAMVNRGHVSLEIREVMGLAPISGSQGTVILLPLKSASAAIFAPDILTNTELDIPVMNAETSLFPPLFLTGAVVELPISDAEADTYTPFVGIGAVIDVPMLTADADMYVPTLPIGAGVVLPLLGANASVFVPVVASGAVVDIPTILADAEAYPPSIGNAVLIALPTAIANAERYVPRIAAGSMISLPSRSAEASTFAPNIGSGAIIFVPSVDAESSAYPVRVPGFDAGFDDGFA